MKSRSAKTRTLKDGQTVTVHRNDGLRKRCGCPRRDWSSCPHPWHFSFKWKDEHHRFHIDKYADRPISTKDDARDEADRLRRLIRAGGFPPQPAAPAATPEALTFEAFAEKWCANARAQQSKNQKLNDQGIVRRLSAMELAPGESLGQRPIGLFTVDDWETAFAKLGTLAASSFNKYRQAVLAMQEWACDKGYLPRPWLAGKVIRKGGPIARRKGARRDRRLVPDVLDDKGRVKTPGEERRLMDQASPWLQRLIIAALETCCRRGELLGLQWRDVSLARGELTIRAENAKDREKRVLPISPNLTAVLQLLQLDPAGDQLPPGAHVFGDKIGRKVSDPKKSWGVACQAAHVVDLHFHDLRHEAASRLTDRGWSLQDVQQMLGHADAKTTSIYVNSSLQGLHDSMRRFGTGGRQPLHDVAHVSESEPPPPCNDTAQQPGKPLVN